ncbi:hypothetical protein DRQ36_08835, partial [bacterium]
MKKLTTLFLFSLAISVFAVEGGSCVVSGFVTDSASGEAIAGANLKIEGEPYGAACNIHGFYTIPAIPKGGPFTLVVSAIGYKSIKKQIVCSEEPIRLDFELAEEAIVAEEVVIEAKRVGGMEDPYVGHTIVESRLVKYSPGLAEPDLFRSLQLLPGVLAISDFTSGLYIWGLSPGENLILLDNIRVYNPTHLMGFFSTFIVEAVREANLVKGGYPAKWGGSLGSVLEVTNKDGNRKNFEGMAQLSLLSGKFLVEGPVANGSYMVGGRRTWIDLATKMLKNQDTMEEDIPYYFYDIQGRVNQDFTDRDIATFSFYAGDDIFAIEEDEENPPEDPGDTLHPEENDDDFEYRWGNVTLSAQWTHIFNERLFGHMVLAGSRFRAKLEGDNNDFNLNNSVGDVSLKGDMSYFYSNEHTLSFGGMLKWRECHFKIDEAGYEEEPGSGEESTFSYDKYTGASIIALYGEEEYKPNIFWRVQAGLRTEYATNGGYFRVGPRLSAQRRIDDLTTLRFATGAYYQYIHLHNPLEDQGFAVLDVWVPVDDDLKAAVASHFVLGMDTDHLPAHLSTNIYYKRMFHLIEARERFVFLVEDDIHSVFYEGDGWAAGFDLSLEGKLGPFAGWVGYGLGWTMRHMGDANDGLNNGEPYYPKYDRRHSLKLSLGYKPHPRLNLTAAF